MKKLDPIQYLTGFLTGISLDFATEGILLNPYSPLISFAVISWILDVGKLTCSSILALLFGLALSGYTYQIWWMSRPRLEER